MDKKITISNVAKCAGVSIATVSRVINNHTNVDTILREKVNAAIKELNFIPNIYARGLHGQGEKSIAVIVPNIGDSFFSRVVQGVVSKGQRENIKVLVYAVDDSGKTEFQVLKDVMTHNISGVIYAPSSAATKEIVTDVFPEDFPVVIACRSAFIEGRPHIYHNNVMGGYLACKYLLKQGRSSIAFVAGFGSGNFVDGEILLDMLNSNSKGAYPSLDRLEGYVKAIKEHGINVNSSLILGTGNTYEDGYKSGEKLITSLMDFDGVVCSNDYIGAGVISALKEQNISVPGAVSVIGYGASPITEIIKPSLTTVKQEPMALGEKAVEMIIDMISGKSVLNHVSKVSLILGGTSLSKSVE